MNKEIIDFKYFKEHAFTWLLEFWLRPLDVIKEAKKIRGITATIAFSCGFYALLIGIIIFYFTKNTDIFWLLPISFSLVGASVFIVSFGGAFNGKGAICGAIAGAVAISSMSSIVTNNATLIALDNTFSIAFTVAIAIAIAIAIIFSGASFNYILIAIIGISISLALPNELIGLIATLVYALFIVFSMWGFLDKDKRYTMPSIVGHAWGIVWIIILPISSFMVDPQQEHQNASIWGVVLIFALSFSILAGFYSNHINGLSHVLDKSDFKNAKNKQNNWLWSIWGLFGALSYSIYIADPGVVNLNDELELLAYFFIAAPVILTALPQYLFFIVFYREKYLINSNDFSIEKFEKTIPFRYQTLAYPLPYLTNFFLELALKKNIQTALKAIQRVQLKTLQDCSGRNAVLKLADMKETALELCGLIATEYNSNTLQYLAKTGGVGRAVSALSLQTVGENDQPLNLILGDLTNVKLLIFNQIIEKPEWFKSFHDTRQMPLADRVAYSIKEISEYEKYDDVIFFKKILLEFDKILEINNFHRLSDFNCKESSPNIINNQHWLKDGLKIVSTIKKKLDFYTEYANYESKTSRRNLLEFKIEQFEKLDWECLEHIFWKNIGKEIIKHCIYFLKNEFKAVREPLKLRTSLTEESYNQGGSQQLQLKIENNSSILAREVYLEVDEHDTIVWNQNNFKSESIEAHTEVIPNLTFECPSVGRHDIVVTVKALDISSDTKKFTNKFTVNIGINKTPYNKNGPNPYVLGNSLPNNHLFSGRKELLTYLKNYWFQPCGQSSISLIGQHRIGKSSLLQKIIRDDDNSLNSHNIIPIIIDLQSIQNDYYFLIEIIEIISNKLGTDIPLIDREEVYYGFKNYLKTLKTIGKRILIMIDEADRIHNVCSQQLPFFLRSLIQDPQYPILLLFSGTYFLKKPGQIHAFNTTQVKRISYLGENDSNSVLTKTTKNILEFSPNALKKAYQKTHGQPLLLQTIGANIIDTFNETINSGLERSNYVSENDLSNVITKILEEDSIIAFYQFWEDTDTADHYLLSLLAIETDDSDSLGLTLSDIKLTLDKKNINFSSEQIFKIVERLTNEEIFICEGEAYRFAVPLYKGWIIKQWPTDQIRWELKKTNQ